MCFRKWNWTDAVSFTGIIWDCNLDFSFPVPSFYSQGAWRFPHWGAVLGKPTMAMSPSLEKLHWSGLSSQSQFSASVSSPLFSNTSVHHFPLPGNCHYVHEQKPLLLVSAHNSDWVPRNYFSECFLKRKFQFCLEIDCNLLSRIIFTGEG